MRRKKRRNAFLITAACALVGAGLLAAVFLVPQNLLVSNQDPVQNVDEPESANAPEPAEKAEKKAETAQADESDRADEAKKEKAEKKPEKKEEKEEGGGSVDLASVPEPASGELYLTVPKMGLQGDYVATGVDDATLYNGAGRAPQSGLPWVEGSNTYIASHVLGYAGTGSYMHFAALPNMTYGDEISLTDANGTTYTYAVSEILQVSIYDLWVMDPTGKTQVSLQTCINPPAYDVRLVVRGDLVDVKTA